jgi:hypothetical protein
VQRVDGQRDRDRRGARDGHRDLPDHGERLPGRQRDGFTQLRLGTARPGHAGDDLDAFVADLTERSPVTAPATDRITVAP